MHDARDAKRTGEAQQVGQEAEGDAEDKGPAEGFPQSPPDPLGALRRCALGSLQTDLCYFFCKKGKIFIWLMLLSQVIQSDVHWISISSTSPNTTQGRFNASVLLTAAASGDSLINDAFLSGSWQ